jgi:P4 family phage/plasmid primase-like protien
MCSCRQGGKCESAGKHPKDNAWQKAERLSAADIQATWDVETPPNIGLATGTESGFWVLDIDPKGGGMESMAALVATHGPLPETFVVQTGSGGFHYGFLLPPDFEVRNDQSGQVGPGIDVRGKGGQVVTAPSVTDKGAYVVVADLPVAPAPQWLLELVRKEDREIAAITAEDLPKPEDITESEWARLSAYAQRAIDSELARLDAMKAAATVRGEGYTGEPWNHGTFEVACSLLEFANSPWCAYSTGQAQADLVARAPRDEMFDGTSLTKIWNSARERIGNKARAMPVDRKAEPDALFGGPDVRPNPTEGTGPAEPGAVPRGGRVYFGGEKGTTPLYQEMALGILDKGPIGYGRDRDFWSYADGVWSPDEFVLKDRLESMLGNAWREAHATNVATPVRVRSTQITGDPIESLMNFRNGMLDWASGDLIEHDPSYASTVQFACEWDAEAECPQFDKWLGETLHADYVDLCWEMIGYLLLSGNPKHRAFLLYGIGGSGKSTLLRLVTHLLGEHNIAAETLDDLNGNRFRTASLFGKIANIAGDIDASYQENTATFKRITGEDMITAENKGMKPFRFVNWAVPVFSANKIPGSADVTEGYLRRWVILRFTRAVAANERIDSLETHFYNELPGIAAKAVRALRDLMDRGDFDEKGEVLIGKEEFAKAIDQVRQWIGDGQVTGGPGVETSLRTLYDSYKIWAERSGNRSPVREAEFSHRLESIGFPCTKVAGESYHTGLSVPAIVHHNNPSTFFGGS